MVDGNELPSSEAALFARMIVLHFEDNSFSKESTHAYKTLLQEKEYGFCNITREILKHNNLIRTKFKSEFETIFHELKTELTEESELADRQIRHVALLLTPYKLLQGKFSFPIAFQTYKESVVANIKRQDDMANDLKDATIFWSSFAYKLSLPYNDLLENTHYAKDPIKKILYIKYILLYPCYAEYVIKNKLHFLDMNSLRSLLTSKGNKSFIPNMSQTSRKAKCYTHSKIGSCYMFKYKDSPESNGIIVDGVELPIK